MKWVWLIGCFVLMTLLFLIYEKIKFERVGSKSKELFFKGGATAVAALLAGSGYFSRPSPMRLLVLLGLCVCAAADVILDLHFLAGTIAFGLGHVCYCAAMLTPGNAGWWNLAVFAALAAAVGMLYPKLKQLAGKNSPAPYLVYALLICALLSLSLAQRKSMMLGALLFAVSDGMLLYRILRKNNSKPYDYVCLGCYYLAQYLIAASAVL